MSELRFIGNVELADKPKLFFCDVDRTLLTHDHRLLPSVSASMRELQEIKLPIILTSARSPTGLERVHDQVGASDVVCCFNGAWIGRLQQRETIRETRLERSVALDAMSAIHAAGGSPIWFDLDGGHVLAQDEAVARRRTDVTRDRLSVIDSVGLAPGAPFKLLATFPADEVADAAHALSRAFADRLTVAQSGPNLVEVVSPEVRKDIAAAFLAETWSVDVANVVAAGDSDNDLEILKWAGLAITVANAKPHIQRVADIVAPSCDDGGLATALDWLTDQVSKLPD